jgi:hypothetical protein
MLQDEVAVPSIQAPTLSAQAAAAAGDGLQDQQQQQILQQIADSMPGSARGMDPVAVVDLAARAFSILAEFGAGLYASQPWAHHLQERAAMVCAGFEGAGSVTLRGKHAGFACVHLCHAMVLPG